MTQATFTIGQEVVRTKGDYVVGRKGSVLAIDTEKNRVQVQWYGSNKTWISAKVIEPTLASPEFITKKIIYKGQEVEAINFGSL